MTYSTFFVLGIVLYAPAPWPAHIGSKALFVAVFCVILSMYGGGFATIPAYLADMFGTQFVGAIHGRLLTAWSTAGIIGPVLVNYIREYQIAAGVPREQVYDFTMYILAGLLVLGFICNLLVRPVGAQLVHEGGGGRGAAGEPSRGGTAAAARWASASGGWTPPRCCAWLVVGVPIPWGVWITLSKALVLFR